MKIKKQTKKIIVVISLILVGMLILNYFGLLKSSQLSITQLNSGQSVSPYTCPTIDTTLCKIQGIIECNNPTGTQVCSSCTQDKNSLVSQYGVNNVIRCEQSLCPNPTANCFKGCSGGALYQCTGNFEIKDSLGVSKAKETLAYSSTSPGTKLSLQYDINPGEKVYLSGADKNNINYATYKETLDCGAGNKNVCNAEKTGYYSCTSTNGVYAIDKSKLTYCDADSGFICDDNTGNCGFPLTYSLKFIDSNGNEKSGFNPIEKIFLSSKITASQYSKVKTANVNFIIYPYGSETQLNNYNVPNYDFTTPSSVSIPINNPGQNYLGQQFYVVIAITYNGKTIYLGKENKEYSFRIAPQLTCNAQYMSNINGQTRTTLYQNYPVDLNIYVTESDLASPVDSFTKLIVNLNSGVSSSTIPLSQSNLKSSGVSSTSAYVYTFEFIPSSVGNLDSIIQIQKSGVTADCTVTSPRVEALTVTPAFTNIAKYTYKCVPQNTPVTFDIETKDSLGNYVDVDNTLKVVFSSTTLQNDITNLLIKDGIGKYHFAYNFPQLGSTYFQISSKYYSGINTGSLDVLSNCNPPECTQNLDCNSKGSGYVCQNNKCVLGTGNSNFLLYLVIGIAIFVVIIAIIIVIVAVRKPKQQLSTGIAGL